MKFNWSVIVTDGGFLEEGKDYQYVNLNSTVESLIHVKIFKSGKNHQPWPTHHHFALLAETE